MYRAFASVTYTRAGYVPDLSGFNSSTVELNKCGKPEDAGNALKSRSGYTHSQFAAINGIETTGRSYTAQAAPGRQV